MKGVSASKRSCMMGSQASVRLLPPEHSSFNLDMFAAIMAKAKYEARRIGDIL